MALTVWELLTESGSVLNITALFDTSDTRSAQKGEARDKSRYDK
jgi:hypothetical protein